MNKRMKELMKQAEEYAIEAVPYFRNELGGSWEKEMDRVRYQKFAELIIKECGEVAAFGDPEYYAQHNIHKHFGVK